MKPKQPTIAQFNQIIMLKKTSKPMHLDLLGIKATRAQLRKMKKSSPEQLTERALSALKQIYFSYGPGGREDLLKTPYKGRTPIERCHPEHRKNMRQWLWKSHMV